MKGDPFDSLEVPPIEDPADPESRVPLSPSDVLLHAVGFVALMLGTGMALLLAFSQLECDAEGTCGKYCPPEGLLFVIAILSGAAGGLVHAATSFAVFAGNRQLYRSWLSWFYLRAPIGSLVALLAYFGYRAGVFGDGLVRTCSAVYMLALAAGVAGLFSKQATDRLADIVDNLLTPSKRPERKDPLESPAGEGAAARQSGAIQDSAGVITPGTPNELTREVQQLLVKGGYLLPTKASGAPIADGIADDRTRAAIEAFLRNAGIVGEARAATLGEEAAPDFWPNLRDLLKQAHPE